MTEVKILLLLPSPNMNLEPAHSDDFKRKSPRSVEQMVMEMLWSVSGTQRWSQRPDHLEGILWALSRYIYCTGEGSPSCTGIRSEQRG